MFCLLFPPVLIDASVVAVVVGSACLGRLQGFFQATVHGFVVLGTLTGAIVFLEPVNHWLAYEGVPAFLGPMSAYGSLVIVGLASGTLLRRQILTNSPLRFSGVLDGWGGLAVGLITGTSASAIFLIGLTMLPPMWSAALSPPRGSLDFGRSGLICLTRGFSGLADVDALLQGDLLDLTAKTKPGSRVSSEVFVDLNSDGSYTAGEPFLDETRDGQFSDGLPFEDLDGDNKRTIGFLPRYQLRSWGMAATIESIVPELPSVASNRE